MLLYVDSVAEVDMHGHQRVAARRILNEVFVVAAFGVGDAVEDVGFAAFAVVFRFHIATGVVRLALRRDVISLLQEVVVGSADGAVGGSEDGGCVETEGWNGEVFIDIGNMIHVLVPDLAGRCPIWAAKNVDSSKADIIAEVLVEQSRDDDFGLAVAVHVGDYRVFDTCSSGHHSGVDVVRSDGVVACNMALTAGVDDAQVVVVAIDEFHDVVLVEVE